MMLEEPDEDRNRGSGDQHSGPGAVSTDPGGSADAEGASARLNAVVEPSARASIGPAVPLLSRFMRADVPFT